MTIIPFNTILPFNFRDAVMADIPFIMSTWQKCARTIPPWTRLSNAAFYNEEHGYRAHVIKTLKKANVLVAVDKTDPDNIFGYIVFEPEPATIHFLYVRGGESSMRSMQRKVGVGVGTELVKAALPNFGKEETLATERYRYPAQWNAWCHKYKIRFQPVRGKDQ